MPKFHRSEIHRDTTQPLQRMFATGAKFETVRAHELQEELKASEDLWTKHARHFELHPKDKDGEKALAKTLAANMEMLRELREIAPKIPLLETKLIAAEIGFHDLQQRAGALDKPNWPWE